MVSSNVLLWLDDCWLSLGWERQRDCLVVSRRLQGKLAVKGEISIEYLQMQAKLPGKSRRLMRSLTCLIINIYLIKENGQRETDTEKQTHTDKWKAPSQIQKTWGLTLKPRFDLKTTLWLSLFSSRHVCHCQTKQFHSERPLRKIVWWSGRSSQIYTSLKQFFAFIVWDSPLNSIPLIVGIPSKSQMCYITL